MNRSTRWRTTVGKKEFAGPMHSWTKWLCWLLSTLGIVAIDARSLLAGQPNIVVILTDDQGFGDISAHGNPILKTPSLDRLRSESVRFNNFFVSPTCSPTRSALMTGRHEFRNGVTHTILERERLTLDATTIAQVLQSAGYATGIFGKWHLGDEADYQPNRRGFDEVFIHGGGGIGQSYPGSCGDAPGNKYFDPTILHNGRFEKTHGYCTDVFFDQATQWMRQEKGRRPFFCWIATNAPHSPYDAKAEDIAIYDSLGLDPSVRNFFAMIHNIDQNVGKLLNQLDQWQIAEDTIVIMMNDNGTAIGHQVFAAGMRGSKGTPWLGGTRAFSFWRWPQHWAPSDCNALTAHIDVFRTLAELGGASLTDPIETQVEGRNLTPLLSNPNSEWPDRYLVTHLGRWPKGTDPSKFKYSNCAIRNQRYTLVSVRGTDKPTWELFDIQTDPSQSTDLSSIHPEIVGQLQKEYDRWWDSITDALVNESAVGPAENPFKLLYHQQFPSGSN